MKPAAFEAPDPEVLARDLGIQTPSEARRLRRMARDNAVAVLRRQILLLSPVDQGEFGAALDRVASGLWRSLG